jgi:hypothetical protein
MPFQFIISVVWCGIIFTSDFHIVRYLLYLIQDEIIITKHSTVYLFDVSSLLRLSGTKLSICFCLLKVFYAQFCPVFISCITSFLSCCYFILVFVLGIFLLSFISKTSSIFGLHSYNAPKWFYSVIHRSLFLNSPKFFLLFTLWFSLLDFLNTALQLPLVCWHLPYPVNPHLTGVMRDLHVGHILLCWVVTAITHCSNGLLQDWLQETELPSKTLK